MARTPIKKRPVGPVFSPPNPIPARREGADVLGDLNPATSTLGRPSGASAVDAYIKATKTPAYQNATPQAKRKFRRQTEADMLQFKDVI